MTTQATKNNRANIAKFNAAYEAGQTKSVCAKVYPHIGGERAVFYRNTSGDGGWLIHTENTGPASSRDIAVEISNSWVDKADAVEYDPYNDASYASAMLRLSADARGVNQDEDCDC